MRLNRAPFVEWRANTYAPGAPSSPASLADTPVLLRLGRQELNYGGMRILTFRDGPNVRQSFDAAPARIRPGAWKIDAFYAPRRDLPRHLRRPDQRRTTHLRPLRRHPALRVGRSQPRSLHSRLRPRHRRFPSGIGSDARYIGTQADASVTWTYNRHLSVELTYARFWAGEFLRETGPAKDVDYVSVLTRFRF
jgi:hypothetical protein